MMMVISTTISIVCHCIPVAPFMDKLRIRGGEEPGGFENSLIFHRFFIDLSLIFH